MYIDDGINTVEEIHVFDRKGSCANYKKEEQKIFYSSGLTYLRLRPEQIRQALVISPLPSVHNDQLALQ